MIAGLPVLQRTVIALLFAGTMISTAFCGANEARAEDDPPIAVHRVKPSSVRFIDRSASSGAPAARLGVEYRSLNDDAAAAAESYDALPSCTAAAVRRQDIGRHTLGSDSYDVLYYAPEDPEQVRRAGQWKGVKAPFLAGALYTAAARHDEVQCFARLLHLRCLPTRFHFADTGGKRVAEFREGDDAWTAESSR